MNTVKRDISSTEASFELSCIPLYRSSHQFQSISITGARVLECNGHTLTKQTPLDKYLQRPDDDLSSFYQFICKSGKVPVLSGGTAYATWPLQEDYCRTMLILHWPNWRNIRDIVGSEDKYSWVATMQSFLSSDTCPNFVKADIERSRRKYESTETTAEDSEEEFDPGDAGDQPEWMDILEPNNRINESSALSPDFEYDDGGPTFDWTAASLPYPESHKTFLTSLSTGDEEDSVLNLLNVDPENLNQEQKFAFSIILDSLAKYIDNDPDFQPLRMVIAGTAGTGKSFLIKCLVKAVRNLFQTNNSVKILCPTGSSANLISGVTIHSFFKIPTSVKSSRDLVPPKGVAAEQLQRNCDGVHVLLIDERSLVGCNTLGWMEFMARYGMTNGEKSSLSWGGLPVVVFLGDDVQLPPVCDTPVYKIPSSSPASLHGSLVWKEFNSAVFLSKIVRQDESQEYLKNVLMSLRDYSTTLEQAVWLQQFQWDNIRIKYGSHILSRMNDQGLFVFPTHDLEWEHNKNQLLAANTSHPIARINAQNQGAHSKGSQSDAAGGLLASLFLCKTSKVMLTSNLDVKNGLFNGSVGEIIDIIYNANSKPPDLPKVVFVQFQKYKGPAFLSSHPQIVPILPIERRIDCLCHQCKRTRIPLRLGWGTTIHRCQGMTIGSGEPYRYIIIHPGTCAFESKNPGALFVALSRAKTAGDDNTDPDFAWHPDVLLNADRIRHTVNTPTTRARSSEKNRLKNIAAITKQKFPHLYSEE